MTSLSFTKVEGLRNDFVLLDERNTGSQKPQTSVAQRISLCDRHAGVGADGVLTLLGGGNGCRGRMHLTNADGSVAEMCGNGLRCVALYLARTDGLDDGATFDIDTGAGVRGVVVDEVRKGSVTVDMGVARFEAPEQFVALQEQIVDGIGPCTTVSMGNPHVVIAAEPDAAHAAAWGARLERHAHFPQRTNVEVAALRTDGVLDVVVWERGVGLTQACGTGACAVVAAFVKTGRLQPGTHRVRLPGGLLEVTLPDLRRSVWMCGPTRVVFTGAISFADGPRSSG